MTAQGQLPAIIPELRETRRQHVRYACCFCPGDYHALLITYASDVKIPHADRGSCFRHTFPVDERSAAFVMVRVQC